MRLNQSQDNDALKGCGKGKMSQAAAGLTQHTVLWSSSFFYI
jgi:hypothetical protein